MVGAKASRWVRLFIFLGLWVIILNLLVGCERGTSAGMASQPPSQTSGWADLAPGIRYQEEDGRVSLDITPPLLTEESVQKFAEFAQRRMAQAAIPEEKEFWEEHLRFVEEQYVLWSDEELVISALKGAFTSRFPVPEEHRPLLRKTLKEAVQQMKRYGSDNPPDIELAPELRDLIERYGLPGDARELP